jgi:hypothetical protein
MSNDNSMAYTEEESVLQKQIYVEDSILIVNVEYVYEIELSRITDYGQILGWVNHLCEKTWMNPTLIRRFISVACKANNLQLQSL